MANITHNDPLVTESKLTEFYNDIKPFLGCPAYVTQEGDSNYYSTEEKVVGRWTNGKPLYQKTITGTLQENANWYSVTHGATDVDSIIDFTGLTKKVSDVEWFKFNYFAANDNYILATISTQKIWLKNDNGKKNQTYFITFTYTKTTDSAATTIEQKPTHYSTDEQVVGTWIDGKPIYQKTYYVGTLGYGTIENAYVASIDISSDSSKWGTVVDLSGMAYNSTTKNVRPLPFSDPVSNNNAIRFDVTGNPSLLRAVCVGNWDNGYLVYATIKYTKNTD